MGLRLKAIRVSKGITQKYVAKYLGVTQATLSRKEAGESNFTAEELIRLCMLYEINDVRNLLD